MNSLHRFLIVILLPLAIGYAGVPGCASAIKQVESVSDPGDDAKLSKCRKEARTHYASDASADEAYQVYFNCTKDAGLR